MITEAIARIAVKILDATGYWGAGGLMAFALVTLFGATMWNTFLLVCGMKLREHWTVVQKYSHQVDIVVLLVAAAGIVWFVRKRLKEKASAVQSAC